MKTWRTPFTDEELDILFIQANLEEDEEKRRNQAEEDDDEMEDGKSVFFYD